MWGTLRWWHTVVSLNLFCKLLGNSIAGHYLVLPAVPLLQSSLQREENLNICCSICPEFYFIGRQCAVNWYANMCLHEIPSVCLSYLSLLYVTSKVPTVTLRSQVSCVMAYLSHIEISVSDFICSFIWCKLRLCALLLIVLTKLPSYEENSCVWMFVLV